MKVSKKCLYCGSRFYRTVSSGIKKWEARRYCSLKCSRDALTALKPVKVCLICGKSYKTRRSSKSKYCSVPCYAKALSSGMYPDVGKYLRHDKKTMAKIGLAHRGIPSWNKGLKLSKLHCQHLSQSHLISTKQRGSNHPLWKGGITPENVKIRTSSTYKQWRDAVFKRDRYTCQKTHKKGGCLVAHHIRSFANYQTLRFEVNNGVTLSKEAHNEFHRMYGRCRNNKQQFIKFLKGGYENSNNI